MASSGAPSLAQRGPPLVEVYDVLDEGVLDQTASGSGKFLYQGLEPTTIPVGFWFGSQGVVTPADIGNGVRAWKFIGTVASVSKGTGAQWGTPLQKKLGTAPGVLPMLRRYRSAGTIWRDVYTGGAALTFGLLNLGNGNGLADNPANWGLEIRSDPATYGGNWHARKRLLNAGAITLYSDSTLSALVPRRIVFDYLEGFVRTLTVRIDGVQIYQEQGDGLLAFAPPTGSQAFGINVGLTLGAGSNGFLRDVMYRAEFLSDPWAGL
jgi:hypothetical protein